MRRWDLLQEIEALRREFDRLFAGLPVVGSGEVSPIAFLPGRAARAYPLMNLSEDRENLYLEALAPGVDPQSLNLTVHQNLVTVSGEKLAPAGVPQEAFHRSERASGKFVRTVEVPVDVDSDRVQAQYTHGLLRITLPKSEAARPRQIQVAVG